MPDSGICLSGLRARLDEQALLAREARVTIDAAVLQLSAASLARIIPPDQPFRVEGLKRGRIQVRTQLTAIGGQLELGLGASPEGRVRVRFLSFQAAGLLRLPIGVVMLAVRSALPRVPGLYPGEGDSIEFDVVEAAQRFGVRMAPLRGAAVGDEAIELRFER